MRSVIRWAVALVIIVHGLIHLLGAVDGFGWAEVSTFHSRIGPALGLVWLLAGTLVVIAGLMVLRQTARWWAVTAVAALASQLMIVTAWSDARAGTLANLFMVLVALFGLRAYGPSSLRATFHSLSLETERAATARRPAVQDVVSEDDLAHLPRPVADYIRAAGSVGRPHLVGFRATISGKIRGSPDEPWMPWNGSQVNTFTGQRSNDEHSQAARIFFMDATMKGVPTDVLHVYRGQEATMRVRIGSVFDLINSSGPELTRAETVTLLNDLCVLAPAALVDAPIKWAQIDDHHVAATFANAGHTISATLVFDDDHRLIDFVSDDRLRAERDGRSFIQQRWSTPVGTYRSFAGRWVGTDGLGRWHPPDGPSFDYLQFHLDDIRYIERVHMSADQARSDAHTARGRARQADRSKVLA